MHILLKQAPLGWQWRRVALHEGHEGLDRGAVFASLFVALPSPRLSMPVKALPMSVVVDGQWTQLRKYRTARSLSPLCALCGSEEGSLTHRHVRCSEVLDDVELRKMSGPFFSAAQLDSLWKLESFASRALRPALKRRPSDFTRSYETRWQGDRSLFTGVVHGDDSSYEGQGRRPPRCGLVANTAAEQSVLVTGTLPYLTQDVDGAELFVLFMFLRIAPAPAQYVTDSSFVEQSVNQRGRKVTEASTSAWADLWRDAWREIDAWGGLGDDLSVQGQGAPLPRRYAWALSLLRTASLDRAYWLCEVATRL